MSVTFHPFAKNVYFGGLIIKAKFYGRAMQLLLCILASFGGTFLKLPFFHFTPFL
jgi:hypothetical protein